MVGDSNIAVSSVGHKAEQFLILVDLRFYRELARLDNNQRFKAISLLALLPHLSAIVWDSARYLQRKVGEDHLLPDALSELLLRSRLRIKLLMGNRKSFLDALDESERFIAINEHWFRSLHRGILGPLKRRFQPDLGLYFVNGALVCTTHIASLNYGFDEVAARGHNLDSLNKSIYGVAYLIGVYTGMLLHLLETDYETPSKAAPSVSFPSLTYRDCMSRQLYAQIGEQLSPSKPSLSLLLTSLLSLANSARFFVPPLSKGHEFFSTKTRFLLSYHVATNLRRLLDEHAAKRFLLPQAVSHIESILGTRQMSILVAQKPLRNTFMHYGLNKKAKAALDPSLPYFGIVEAVTNSLSYSELCQITDESVVMVSTGLAQLLPPQAGTQKLLED